MWVVMVRVDDTVRMLGGCIETALRPYAENAMATASHYDAHVVDAYGSLDRIRYFVVPRADLKIFGYDQETGRSMATNEYWHPGEEVK